MKSKETREEKILKEIMDRNSSQLRIYTRVQTERTPDMFSRSEMNIYF